MGGYWLKPGSGELVRAALRSVLVPFRLLRETKFLNWDSRGSELTNSLIGIGFAIVLVFINPDMWEDSGRHVTVKALDFVPAWVWATGYGTAGAAGLGLLISNHIHARPRCYAARRWLLLAWAGWWLALAVLTVWQPPRGSLGTAIFFALFLKSGIGFVQIRALRERV